MLFTMVEHVGYYLHIDHLKNETLIISWSSKVV